MKKCNIQDNKIPLSRLVHSTLIYIEKRFLISPTESNISYVSKMMVMRNLCIAKNTLLKLYVIVIWLRKKSKFLNQKSSGSEKLLDNNLFLEEFAKTIIKITGKENILSNKSNLISDYALTDSTIFNDFSLFPFKGKRKREKKLTTSDFPVKPFTEKYEETSSTSNEKIIIPIENILIEKISLFMLTHKDVIFLYKFKRKSKNGQIILNYFLKDKKYGFVSGSLGSKSKIFMKDISINWPKTLPALNHELLHQYILANTKPTDNRVNPFEFAYNFLRRFYLVGQFAFTIQKLIEYSSEFHYTIEMKNDHSATIFFPDFYFPLNLVKVELHSTTITISSCSPLMKIPERNPHSGLYDVFIPFDKNPPQSESGHCHKEIPAHKKFLLTFGFSSFDEIDLPSILTEFLGAIYFTFILHYFYSHGYVIRQPDFNSLAGELVCNGAILTQTCINVTICRIKTITFKVDWRNGFVMAKAFSNDLFSQKELPSIDQVLNLDPWEVALFIQKEYNVIKLIICSELLFGPHFYNLLPHILPSWNFGLMFSFACDYFFTVSFSLGFFQIVIMSKRSGTIEASKSISSMNFFQFKVPGNRNEVTRTFRANKNLIFLLQIEEELRAKGFLTSRNDSCLKIAMRPILAVNLKIKDSGYWSLTFNKSSYPFFSKNLISIVGKQITCRSSLFIVQLLTEVQQFSSLVFQSSSVNRFPTNTTRTIIIHELCALVQAEGHHILIDFYPFNDVFTEKNGVTNYVLHSGLCVSMRFHVQSNLSIISSFDSIQLGQSEVSSFGAFLDQQFAALNALIDAFQVNGKFGWSISRIPSVGPFFLVYKGQLSLNLLLQPDTSFLFTVPLAGNSCFLMLPLLSLFQASFTIIDTDEQSGEDFMRSRKDVVESSSSDPRRSTSNAKKAFQRASFATFQVKCTDLANAREAIESYYLFFEAMNNAGVHYYFFSKNCLFGARFGVCESDSSSQPQSQFDLKIKITQSLFVIESTTVPLIRNISVKFNEVQNFSFVGKRSLFVTLLKILELPKPMADNVAAVLNAFLLFKKDMNNFQLYQSNSFDFESLARQSRIDLAPISVMFYISEDDQPFWISSENGVEFKISFLIGGMTKVYDFNSLLKIIQYTSQNGLKLMNGFVS